MLKILLMRKQKERKEAELAALLNKIAAAEERAKEVERAIEEVTEEVTAEEMKDIEAAVEEVTKEKEDLLKTKADLEAQLNEIEKQIDEIEDEEEAAEELEENKIVLDALDQERNLNKKIEKRGGNMIKDITTRQAVAHRLENPEVREFFTNISQAMQKRATLTGAEYTVPTEVINAINVRMEKYGNVLKLVKKVYLNGNARVIVNGGKVTFFWTEKCASLQEVTLPTLRQVELDNFKFGGYVFICNATLEDSQIDLAAWIEEEFARGLAAGFDHAILLGTGAENKQPEGILTVVTDVTEVNDLGGALTVGAAIQAPNKTYVMNEATYTTHIATKYLNANSNGEVVLGINQVMPNGARIELNEDMAADEFLVGAFDPGYILGLRNEAKFDTNDRLKWTEEETGFKLSVRADGKVTDTALFARGKFVPAAPVAPDEQPAG